MSITSGKIIICTGLAALALAACGNPYDDPPPWDAGAGGQGGSMIEEVEMFKCDEVTHNYVIKGTSSGQDGMTPWDYEYIPKELTIKVGQIVQFSPNTASENMTSGPPPYGDGKFKTTQGSCRALKFNVAGTYPFFSIDLTEASDHMEGIIYVK